MARRSGAELSTDREVASAKPLPSRDGKYRIREFRIAGAPNLVLRVLPSGKKSWVIWAKSASGAWRKLGVGSYPAVGLSKARAKAVKVTALAADGIDPFAQRSVGTAGTTLKQLADRFIERHSRPKKRSWKEDERILSVYFASLAGVRADRVTRTGIVDVLDDVADRNGGIMANRALAVIRKLYNWAASEGHISVANPAAGIPLRAKEVARTRVLSHAEIRRFWHGLDGDMGFDPCTAAVLKLALLTGARLGEIVNMPRVELALNGKVPMWVLPAARAKGGRAVPRPLAPMALAIIEKRLAAADSAVVFPSPFNVEVPMGREAPWRAISRAAKRGLVPDYSPHDLRRTFRTELAKLGVAETVAKKLLGHVPPRSDVTGAVYDQHSYLPEMLAALQLWERTLKRIVRSA